MARREAVPSSELEICRRLRQFRLSTKIPRAAFAIAVGITADRLSEHENGRVPLRYEVFKAIHSQFHVSPMWLVEEKGTMEFAYPLNLLTAEVWCQGRDLLSACYTRSLRKLVQERRSDQFYDLSSPGGVARRIDDLVEFVELPDVELGLEKGDIVQAISRAEVLLKALRAVSIRERKKKT